MAADLNPAEVVSAPARQAAIIASVSLGLPHRSSRSLDAPPQTVGVGSSAVEIHMGWQSYPAYGKLEA